MVDRFASAVTRADYVLTPSQYSVLLADPFINRTLLVRWTARNEIERGA